MKGGTHRGSGADGAAKVEGGEGALRVEERQGPETPHATGEAGQGEAAQGGACSAQPPHLGILIFLIFHF